MKSDLFILKRTWIALIPIYCISLYVIMFFLAKYMYGSGMDTYEMCNQLMCEMMESFSANGHDNSWSKGIASFGHIFLFIGMSLFFYLLPMEFKEVTANSKLFQALGVLAMLLFILLSTELHDTIVLISGCISSVAGYFLIREYLSNDLSFRNLYSVFCLILSIGVFISYQFKVYSEFLPVYQKVVFLFDSIWVYMVCSRIYQMRLVVSGS